MYGKYLRNVSKNNISTFHVNISSMEHLREHSSLREHLVSLVYKHVFFSKFDIIN